MLQCILIWPEKFTKWKLLLCFHCSHNTRTTQWQDPRTELVTAALSQSNLFTSSSENSSVETLFSTPVILGSSQNGNYNFFPTSIASSSCSTFDKSRSVYVFVVLRIGFCWKINICCTKNGEHTCWEHFSETLFSIYWETGLFSLCTRIVLFN
jgi:hypothetical protein